MHQLSKGAPTPLVKNACNNDYAPILETLFPTPSHATECQVDSKGDPR